MTESKQSLDRSLRKEWLRKNAPLWKDIDPTDFKASHSLLTTLALQLQQEGLYSSETLLMDVEMGVFKMVRKLLQGRIN